MIKKLSILLISLGVVYFATEWIIRGIYFCLIRSFKYITFASPMVHITKYFAVAIMLIILFIRYIPLAPAGKKLLPLFLVLSIAGFFITSLWFNAVNEEKIVKFRVVWGSSKSWDDVDYVSTNIYREDHIKPRRDNQLMPLKVIKKYNLHLKDGSSLNVWNNLDSVYELHQFVLEKDIRVEHKADAEYFDQNFASYFKKSLPKAHVIFGVE
ncbi:hypothetical protein [Bacillus niameyensis]|uniref:hypothetical protein n=1 Tax=Bacillus niameyensis TaxID=1522308 RepID=UPI0007848B83|nr:hypothetical protein [Bacillus niameyensis]